MDKLTICCLSDLHGTLPKIPDCDLLLLGGDYCPHAKGQNWWLRDQNRGSKNWTSGAFALSG